MLDKSDVFAAVARADGYVIRAAREQDRDGVAALCQRAWPHGEDYVPEAWDAWLADPQGLLLVAENGQDLAAVGRLAFLAAHEGWLEGLRVDPDHRRIGLATWILEVCLSQARAQGATVTRLATGAGNAATHRSAARLGMARVGAFLYYSAPPLPGAEAPRPLAPDDVAQARELLRVSPALAATGGLYETYFCWPELTDARLAEAVALGQAFGAWNGRGRLAALAIVQGARAGERTDDLVIGLLAGEPPAIAGLARSLRGVAARRGLDHVEAKLPELAPLREAAVAAGYAPDEGFEIWVFEKQF